MTTSSYPLSGYIRWLRHNFSLEKIPARIDRKVATGQIKLSELLPPNWKVKEKSRDRYDIVAPPDFCRDADTFAYCKREATGPLLGPDLTYKAHVETILADSKPLKPAPGSKLDDARKWIATLPTLKGMKARCMETCKTKHDVGSHIFETQVWGPELERRGIKKRVSPKRKRAKTRPKRRSKN